MALTTHGSSEKYSLELPFSNTTIGNAKGQQASRTYSAGGKLVLGSPPWFGSSRKYHCLKGAP